MKTENSNYLNMALAVQKIMKKHAQELATRKMLQQKVSQMNTCITEILYHQKEAVEDSKGTTKSKEDAASDAIELALILANSALEWAKEAKDAVRTGQFDVYMSTFTHVEGVECVARLKNLAEHLDDVAKELEEYDVKAEEIKRLSELTELFSKQMVNPREKIIFRKSHNTMILHGLSELRKIMTSTDNLMSKFKNTPFLLEYESARIVIDLGTRKGKGKDDNPEDDAPEDDGDAPKDDKPTV